MPIINKFKTYFLPNLFRSTRTINGVAPRVMLILTGANTLWIAYAITNVLAPVPALLANAESPQPKRSKRATMSIPLSVVCPRSWTSPIALPCAGSCSGTNANLGLGICLPEPIRRRACSDGWTCAFLRMGSVRCFAWRNLDWPHHGNHTIERAGLRMWSCLQWRRCGLPRRMTGASAWRSSWYLVYVGARNVWFQLGRCLPVEVGLRPLDSHAEPIHGSSEYASVID